MRLKGSYIATLAALAVLAQPSHAQVSAPGAVPAEPASPASPVIDANAASQQAVETVIVTGRVAGGRQPSVAVSALNAVTLQQMAPVSAADLLKNVPGVFVNSALGETRNIVYSRGVSANSVDANGGYYYVSLQEDGLPVTNITASNYGPDFFYRQDISLFRLEALRGGTAVVTGPNAPGGIFNYISRDGRNSPGVEIRERVGLLGDGRNTYHRTDMFAGGETGVEDLFYSIGGFYRNDKGDRNTGYTFNRGGQIKGSLLFDDGTTRLKVTAKYLDDRNEFNEFQPARNFSDPKVIAELGPYSSLITAPNPHTSIPYMGGSERSWDASDLPRSQSLSFGINLSRDLGNKWEIENNFKINHNKVNYNAGSNQYAVPLLDTTLAAQLHLDRAGLYTFRDRSTGAVLAQINRAVAGTAASGAKVVVNNLPNQVLPNAVVGQNAYDTNFDAHEVMDQISLSKSLDNMSFKIGAFLARSSLDRLLGAAGTGIAPLLNQPQTMDISLLTPAGVTQQVTNPVGLTSIGQFGGGTQTSNVQTQTSLFAGHNWEITENFSTDLGVRYDQIKMSGINYAELQNPKSSDPAYGGLDQNPNTIYDNYVVGLSAPIPYSYTMHYPSASGAVTYRIDPRTSVFFRYSQGKKAPDMITFATINSAARRDLTPVIPQEVKQLEFGFKFSSKAFRISANPFYSELSKVGNSSVFSRADGSFYATPLLFSSTVTAGVEIEGDVDFLHAWNLRSAITLQNPKSKDFATWVANAPGEADDTIAHVPDAIADNNPKVMATTTLRYSPNASFKAYASWKYLGQRAANRYNTFFLPAFSLLDLGATYNFSEKFSISGNINNVFNKLGVMSWAGAGSFSSAGQDRQGFTPAQLAANPNALLSIMTSQPRAFYLSASYKF